jgi:hypothetical protein
VRTPTWQEVEEFCRRDGWELIRSTGHSFYRKVLPDGTVLETHVSFAGRKTMSAGRFALILRTQLRVSEDEFWTVLRTGRRAARPSTSIPEAPASLPSWVANALRHQFDKSDEEIAAMDPADAEAYVLEQWSRPASERDHREGGPHRT